MANSDSPTATLRNFAQLSAPYQRAVVLKAQGFKHSIIASQLTSEFGLSSSRNTVNQWFIAGGLLEQAYLEYLNKLANLALRDADLLLKKAALPAAMTLVKLLNVAEPAPIRIRAAQTILKFCIDTNHHATHKIDVDTETLPVELQLAGDEIMLAQNL